MGYLGKRYEGAPQLGKRQVRVALDPLSLLWFVVALTMFQYLGTYLTLDPLLASKAFLGFMLLIGGLVAFSMDSFGVGVVLDSAISRQELIVWVSSTTICTITIIMMNGVVSRTVGPIVGSAAPITSGVFGMLIGVAEEYAWRGWLLNLLSNLTGNDTVAVVISSIIGGTMHAAVYGARSMTIIIIVIVAFMVIGYTYVWSTESLKGLHRPKPVPARRLSITTTGHALNNLMAVLRATRGG
jgi:membrane protease YdiL (CAAX protease family)